MSTAPVATPPTSGAPDVVDVTIVLPAYNEEGHIAEEIERISATMDASEFSYELLVVNDGSTDRTLEILEGIEGIRLIDLGGNHGSGYARRIGSRAAHGEVVVWTDADMTYPNDRIPELVRELGHHDQVVGARTSEEGTHRWARVPAKWFIRRLAQYLTQSHIPDLNSGFRAFRRDVALPYLHLLPHGFSCVTTITMAFLANGHGVRYVPIDYGTRAGDSKFHWRRDTARYGLQVVRMVMTFNPLRVFLPVGLTLLALAFGKVIFDIVDKSFRISSNAIILTVVSLQIVVTGLLADLLVRLHGGRRDIE